MMNHNQTGAVFFYFVFRFSKIPLKPFPMDKKWLQIRTNTESQIKLQCFVILESSQFIIKFGLVADLLLLLHRSKREKQGWGRRSTVNP